MEEQGPSETEGKQELAFNFEEYDEPPPKLYPDDETKESDETETLKRKRHFAELLNALNGHVSPEELGAKSESANYIRQKDLSDDDFLSIPRYPQGLKVFCVQHKGNNEAAPYYRKFHCCAISSVWEVYKESDPLSLHWFEIIREDVPCHLYFDVEYRKTEIMNQSINGDALIDSLVEHVRCTFLYVVPADALLGGNAWSTTPRAPLMCHHV